MLDPLEGVPMGSIPIELRSTIRNREGWVLEVGFEPSREQVNQVLDFGRPIDDTAKVAVHLEVLHVSRCASPPDSWDGNSTARSATICTGDRRRNMRSQSSRGRTTGWGGGSGNIVSGRIVVLFKMSQGFPRGASQAYGTGEMSQLGRFCTASSRPFPLI